MVGGVLINLSEIINFLPQYIVDRFGSLVIILQAVGIAFIVYVIYVVIRMFLGFKTIGRLKIIEKKVVSIDKKLNKLLKDKKKK